MPGPSYRIAPITALLLAAVAALAEPLQVHVGDAWSRATPPASGVGAAYFSLSAHGSGSDHLIGVSTPVAARAELHTHVMQGDLMRMQRVEAVEVHPGAPVLFAPGGNHVMLVGLEAPLREGDRFPLTLTFEKAGDVVVQVVVRGPGATGAHAGHGAPPGPRAGDTAPPADTTGHGHARPEMRKE